MKEVDTYTANIFVGFREHYSEVLHSIDEAYSICQKFCDSISYCVTVTPTTFIYKDGSEPGCIIGLINYPRFPSDKNTIIENAEFLSKLFLANFNQYRITFVCSDKTYMIEQ